jgi:hypothetical protein
LTVRRGGGEPEVHRGHLGLAGVIDLLGQFAATLHEASVPVVEWEGGDEARGDSICVAHHVTRGEGQEGRNLILHGRYSDRFARDESGTWRFSARELRVLWTEKRPVRLS